MAGTVAVGVAVGVTEDTGVVVVVAVAVAVGSGVAVAVAVAVAVGENTAPNSYAPMSHSLLPGVPSPSRFRIAPRWSRDDTGGAVHWSLGTRSIAALPDTRAWVCVVPLFDANDVLRMLARSVAGTTSFAPGVKLSRPALPEWPNRL